MAIQTNTVTTAGTDLTAADLNHSIAQANLGDTVTATFGAVTITEAGPVTAINLTPNSGALTIDGLGGTLAGQATGTAPTLTLTSGTSGAVTIEALTIAAGASGTIAIQFPTTGTNLTAAEVVFAPETASPFLTASSVTGVIAGVGSIVVDATETVTLSAANTYTGKTIVSGTLDLTGAGSIASSHNVSLGATGTLNLVDVTAPTSINELTGQTNTLVALGTNTLTVNENVTNAAFSGTFTSTDNTAHLVLNGPDSLTLMGDSSSFTGHVAINTDVLLTGAGSIADAHNVTLGATGILDVSGVTSGTASVHELTGAPGSRVVLGATTLSVNEDVAAADFSGVISGTGGVTFSGTSPDTLTLQNTETYTGVTEVDSGTLALGPNGSIAASSGVVVNGGTLSFAGEQNSTGGAVNVQVKSLTGTGGTVALGTNNLTITGTNTGSYAGDITGGQTNVGGNTSQGSLTIDAGADLALTGTSDYTGKTLVNGSLTLGGNANISASHNVTLGAAGVLTVDPYCYTTISELTGVAGSVINLVTGTLVVNENVRAASFSGLIEGTGNFTLGGPYSLTLNSAETFTGGTTVNGTLILGANAALADSGSVTVNGTLDLTGAGATNTIHDLNGEGSVMLGSNTLVALNGGDFAGVISGTGNLQVGAGAGPAYNDANSGTLILTGANTYTGKTIVYGTLELSGENSNVIADSHNVSLATSGATLELGVNYGCWYASSNQTIHELTGVAGSYVNLGSSTLTVIEDVVNASFSGTIEDGLTGGYSGAVGSLDVAASTTGTTYTLTLNGTGEYSGNTTIEAGATLALGANGSLGGSYYAFSNDNYTPTSYTYVYGALNVAGVSSGPVVVTNLSSEGGDSVVTTGTVTLGANTLEDAIFNGEMSTFGGTISGTGGLTVLSGDGSSCGGGLILTGANTYTGTTTVDGMIALVLEGSLMTSNIVVNSTAEFDLEVSGTFTTAVTGTGYFGVGDASYVGAPTSISPPSVTITTALANFAGEIDVAGSATLTLGAANAIANAGYVSVYDAGTLNLASAGGTVMITNLGLDSGATLALGANTLELTGPSESDLSGTITGTGGLQVDAGASVYLYNSESASSYTGNTVVYGYLEVESGSNLLSSSHNVALRSGGELVIDSGATTTINELTGEVNSLLVIDSGSTLVVNENVIAAGFSGQIEGTGNFTLGGVDALTLLGADTATGITTIDAGATLAIGVGGSIADSIGVIVNGTLDLTHSGSTVSLIDLQGAGSVSLGATALTDTVSATFSDTFSGGIFGSGSLTVDGTTPAGPGTTGSSYLLLSGANNTFSGGMTIASGTVELATTTSGGTGAITFHDGASSGGGVLQIDALTAGSGGVQTFANTITGLSATGTTAGDIIDLGSVTYIAGATANYNATTDMLTVVSGNATVNLHITGVPANDVFQAFADSSGHTFVEMFAVAGGAAGYEASHYHP